MGIKGSATIELTNADGSKEIYNHDNMITNAVQDLCMSQRGEMATILKIVDNGDSYAQALFGGLLLFDETLNSDPADYFLPTVKCTGYASQDAYGGLDTYRGSFNASEGGVQADGSYKFVWDFATSQANGTIKSLALCPNMMGQIGITSSKVSSESKNFRMKRTNIDPFNSNGYMYPSGTADGFPADGLYIVAVIDDIAYAASMDNIGYRGTGGASSDLIFKKNGGILKLLRFKLGTSSIALTDKVGRASYIDTINVQLPTEFVDSITYTSYYSLIALNYDKANNKIIVFPCQRGNYLSVNSTLKYCEIDLSNNYAVTVYTFTNNTPGKIMYAGKTGTSISYSLYIMKDYIVAESQVGNVYKYYSIKKNDNTQVKEIQRMDGTAFRLNSDQRITPMFNKGRIFVAGIFGDTANYGYIVIDLESGQMRDTNIYDITQSGNIDIGHESVFAMTGKNLTYSMCFNPFILCTKNNLDIPVTKTASQTMKITYTLSVADTEGNEV